MGKIKKVIQKFRDKKRESTLHKDKLLLTEQANKVAESNLDTQQEIITNQDVKDLVEISSFRVQIRSHKNHEKILIEKRQN